MTNFSDAVLTTPTTQKNLMPDFTAELIRETNDLDEDRARLETSNALLRLRIRNLRMINSQPEVIAALEQVAADADLRIAEMARCVHETRSHISEQAQ